MSTGTPNIRVVGQVDEKTGEDLRKTLLSSRSTFKVYNRMFNGLGISQEDILNTDPLAILQQLPLLAEETFLELADESLTTGDRIIDLETSSGTTEHRKRRFISFADDVSDHKALAELFALCGIGSSDRVACLDVDPANLMVSFTKALDLLGVEEAYAFCVGPERSSVVESLPKLDPTVVVGVPSVIDRCFERLGQHDDDGLVPSLAKVVYFGEPLPRHLRSRLESELGVEVFGYYGSTETSALGMECSAHDGIHLLTDRNIIEINTGGPLGLSGQIVVTTLMQRTVPLLRYVLKDDIVVKTGECPCGLQYPRIEVNGRSGEGVSVLGVKVSFKPILRCVYRRADDRCLMQLVLACGARDKLTIVLPESLRYREPQIRESLLSGKHDVGFLIESGYLDLEFSFVDESYFRADRKRRRIVDLRGNGEDARQPSSWRIVNGGPDGPERHSPQVRRRAPQLRRRGGVYPSDRRARGISARG